MQSTTVKHYILAVP